MRTTHRLEIKVGLLIVLGVIGAVIMIMVSDKISFERYYRISAYLPDASGLRLGSPVTLSGIGIGNVDAIEPSTDPRGAIRVDLRVRRSISVPRESTLTVSSSGIFGDSFLAFTPTVPASGESMPLDGTAAVVASPGFLGEATEQAKGILRSLSTLMDDKTRDDAKRLVARAADLADHSAKLAEGLEAQNQRLSEVLENLKVITEDLRVASAKSGEVVGRVDSTLATVDVRVASVSDKAEAALQRIGDVAGRADQLLADHRADLGVLIKKVRDVAVHAASIAAAVDSGDGVLGRLVFSKSLAADVDSIAVDLADAAGTVAEEPEALVWGQSRRERDESRAKREREKMRRKFEQDFGGAKRADAPAPAPAP